jgi:hypothetical protein
MMRLRSAWRFIRFVWRTFWMYWGWAWAKHRGILPIRSGMRNHRFTLHVSYHGKSPPVTGDLVFDDVTLSGPCSAFEAARLLGFRGSEVAGLSWHL